MNTEILWEANAKNVIARAAEVGEHVAKNWHTAVELEATETALRHWSYLCSGTSSRESFEEWAGEIAQSINHKDERRRRFARAYVNQLKSLINN